MNRIRLRQHPASTGEHSNPDHDNASLSLGRFSGFSSLNGMLSLFSSGRSANNINTIGESKNGNGEAETNSNAGLSFGGEDSFQNDDIISYSSPGNVSVGVHDRNRDRHFSRLSPVNSEVSDGENEAFDDDSIHHA